MYAPATPVSRTTTAARPFVAFALLALALYSLLAHWEQRFSSVPMFSDPEHPSAQHIFEIDVAVAGSGGTASHDDLSAIDESKPYNPADYPRKVVAHFMLGNTYPFKERDWDLTLVMAEATGLDGLVLNLGKENWQLEQAKVAYNLATKRIWENKRNRPLQLFLSLDMNVLPAVTEQDATTLADKIGPLLLSPAQMLRNGRPIISTFGGQRSFGGHGWKPFMDRVHSKLENKKVFFWPAFFAPPDQLAENEMLDGLFAWNSAWPLANKTIGLEQDMPYLETGKPFMASVSPLFFTHYGNKGQWAFHKNWIYRSDDLLYPNRWAQIMQLPAHQSPEMIQVLSWNDYGESHHIAPIMGAEPGSTAWTHRMDHTAFREMTTYFAKRWRDGAPEVDESRFSLWMWYRSHPKDLIVTSDTVGRPNHAEWAQDLINLLILVPADIPNPVIEVRAGDERTHAYRLFAGHANGVKVPFTVGEVYVTLRSDRGVHIQGRGATIRGVKHTYMYNFNMWSRGWHVDATHVEGQTDSTGGNKVFQTGEEFHGAGAKPPHMPNPALGHGSNQGFNPSQGSHGGETQPPAQAPPAQPGQHDTPSPHVEAGTQGTVPQTGTDSSADADPA